MLAVALVIGQLTAVLKWQARVAQLGGTDERSTRCRAHCEITRTGCRIAGRFLQSEFEARPRGGYRRQRPRDAAWPSPHCRPASIPAIAQWAFDHAEAAGHSTNAAGVTDPLLAFEGADAHAGVRHEEPRAPARLTGPEQRRLLETCASLVAMSLERVHYVDVAQHTTVQMESDVCATRCGRHLARPAHPVGGAGGRADSLAEARPAPMAGRPKSRARKLALRMNAGEQSADAARLQSARCNWRQWLPLEEAVGDTPDGRTLDPHRVPSPPPTCRCCMDPALFGRVLATC